MDRLSKMNPFEDDTTSARPLPSPPSKPATSPGNPFAADVAAARTPDVNVTASTTQKKPATGSLGNPFAPDDSDTRPKRPQSALSASASTFSPPPSVASSSSRNPFASPGTMRRLESLASGSSSSSNELSWQITSLDLREQRLRHVCLSETVALVVTHHPSNNEYIVSRRDMSNLNKVDGAVPFQDSIENIFLDPAGMHCLVTLKSGRSSSTIARGATFYLNPQDAVMKPRGPLAALEGLSCVGWFRDSDAFPAAGLRHSESRSGEDYYSALAGTNTGVIHLTRFAHNGIAEQTVFFTSPTWTKPGANQASAANKFISILPFADEAVLALESSGTYHVLGWDGQRILSGTLADVSTASSSASSQQGYRPSTSKSQSGIEAFGCVGGESISDDIFVLTRLGLHRVSIDLSTKMSSSSLIFEVDGAFALEQTDLHVLVLSRSVNKQSNVIGIHLEAISKITFRTESNLEKNKFTVQGSSPLAFCPGRSSFSSTRSRDRNPIAVMVFSENGLNRLEINNERKDAWMLYLKRATEEAGNEANKSFAKALDLCVDDKNKDTVRASWGDAYLRGGNVLEAAKLFAETRNAIKPFEEVALALLSSSVAVAPSAAGESTEKRVSTPASVDEQLRLRKKALRVFVLGRLRRLPEHKKTLRTMLCVWLCELFLDEMDSCSTLEKSEKDVIKGEIESDLYQFLGEEATTLEPAKETVFHLIQSHGRTDIMLVYAYLCHDMRQVIKHHVERGSYSEALRAIQDVASSQPNSACDFLYEYSPELLLHLPSQLADLWRRVENAGLDATRLVPALSLFQDHPELLAPTVVYLEHCVNDLGIRDESIHDLLLLAYSHDESRFAAFIRREANQLGGFSFNSQLAMRLCDKVSPKSKVILLESMGLYEEAFHQSLQLDMLDYAQKIATEQHSRGQTELGKRLWLACCDHVLRLSLSDGSNTPNIQRVLDVMHASQGVVSVEDVLLLLPSSIRLDEIRDEICLALERYNSDIDRLKQEMAEHLESDALLHRESNEEKRRFDVIRGSKHCDICRKPLLMVTPEGQHVPAGDVDEFYVFPCTHSFHTRCICTRLKDHVKREVLSLLKSPNETDQAEAENIIGASCPLCGDAMIETISLPLIVQGHEEQAKLWDVPSFQ